MKKTTFFLIILLSASVSHAAVLPTNTKEYYTSNRTNKTIYTQSKSNSKNDNSKPTRFYINAKGGYNLMYGLIYTDEKNDKGFTFSAEKQLFSGAIGIDFNNDPSLMLELEIAKIITSEAHFKDGWDSKANANTGYTSYTLNFIPYFKITDSININLNLGLGAASLDFADTDRFDYLYLKSSKMAFVTKIGFDFDIKLTDSFSILPGIQYNFLVSNIKHSLGNGYTVSDNKTFLMHNCQFTVGAKYTF